MAINDISRIRPLSDVSRVSGLNSSQQTPAATRYNTQTSGQPTVSTSAAYRQHQAELTKLLQGFGFTAEQATKLTQLTHLSSQDLTRSLLLSQILVKDLQLFDGFVRVLKNVGHRGQNAKEGTRTLLDAADRLLGHDTRKLTETGAKLHASGQEIESVLQKSYSAQHRPQENRGFETSLGGEFDARLLNSQSAPPLNGKSSADFSAFLKFFQSSMDEFPTRYPIDIFAQTQFAAKGIALEEYVRLANDVPPLRVLNLIIQAEKQGETAASVVETLQQAMRNGEDVGEALRKLEMRFVPSRGASLLGFAGLEPRPEATPIQGNVIRTHPGQKLLLTLAALDLSEGLLDEGRSGFAIFPQRWEQAGTTLDVSQLPLGVYYVLLCAANLKNQPFTSWIKVIVEAPEDEDEPMPDDAKQKDSESDKEQRQQKQNEETAPAPGFGPDRDFVNTSFSAPLPQPLGRFLGEIILPLDYASRDPGELVTLSPEGGILVTGGEYESGTFPHHAVTFRFLTNYMEPTELLRRHQILEIRPSAVFESFETALQNFSAKPAVALEAFRSAMQEFFARLTNLFPAGAQSFAAAQRMFDEEATRLASGESGGELYDVSGMETNKTRFLASSYVKGGYALAASGDAPGALRSLAKASLCHVDEVSHEAALGEYLETLRQVHYARKTAEDAQKDCALVVLQPFDAPLSVSPLDAAEGEKFIKVIRLEAPVAEPEAPTANPFPFGYNPYRG